jgi:general secretion pathway protein A
MYEKFYGFKVKPFQLVPNPAFLYLGPKHQNALTYLEYGLMERLGFILLTGEVGSGKTTLIKHLLNQVGEQLEVAVIFNTNVTSGQLLGLILNEFEIEHGAGGKARALDLLYQHLIKCYSKNRRVLLIVDEAQNLSKDALEEIRMLSNLQSDDQLLLQIMLVGQPEIRRRLKSKDMAQFNQRISVAYHLPALSSAETAEYIAFRLKKAGGGEDLFTPEAVELIHRASGGIPRTINIICDTALVYGFADDSPVIDANVIDQVLQDRDGMGLASSEPEAAAIASADGAQDAGGLEARIARLEERLARLESRVEWHIDALETAAQAFKDDLVRKMSDLYSLERRKNDRLIFEYSRLKERYLSRLKGAGGREAPAEENGGITGGEPDQEPTAGQDHVAGMQKIIVLEREKNERLQAEYGRLRQEYESLLKEMDEQNGKRPGQQAKAPGKRARKRAAPDAADTPGLEDDTIEG